MERNIDTFEKRCYERSREFYEYSSDETIIECERENFSDGFSLHHECYHNTDKCGKSHEKQGTPIDESKERENYGRYYEPYDHTRMQEEDPTEQHEYDTRRHEARTSLILFVYAREAFDPKREQCEGEHEEKYFTHSFPSQYEYSHFEARKDDSCKAQKNDS